IFKVFKFIMNIEFFCNVISLFYTVIIHIHTKYTAKQPLVCAMAFACFSKRIVEFKFYLLRYFAKDFPRKKPYPDRTGRVRARWPYYNRAYYIKKRFYFFHNFSKL